MSTAIKTKAKVAFKADLDADIATLPGRALKSVADLLIHLQNLAQRQRREATHLWDNENVAPVHELLGAPHAIEPGAFDGYSFREMGRQILGTAREQVGALQLRTCEIQALLLINGWPVAERLWPPLQADCKTPLYEMNLLEDLWGFDPSQFVVNGWSLARHRRQFVLIQADVGILLARQNSLMELSDTLERDLGCWLAHFAKILDRLDDESAS